MNENEEEIRKNHLNSLPKLLQPLIEAARSNKGLTSLECLNILNRWDEARKRKENVK